MVFWRDVLVRTCLALLVGIADDQVVPSVRYTRSKSKSSDLVACLENASESQIGGANNVQKQRKTRKKINDPQKTSPVAETVGKIYSSSSSSAVSFKVPHGNIKESSKAAKTDYENTAGTPEEIEVFDVSAKGCNSATRRKVNHWFAEQCVSPSSLAKPVSGLKTSNRMASEIKRDAEKNLEKEGEVIKHDHGTEASERNAVKFRPSARGKDRENSFNGGLDHILIDSGDSSVTSGPVQRMIRGRTCRLDSTAVALPTQRSRHERDDHLLTNDRPKDTKVNKLSYLRGTPPSRFKAEFSSPGSDDPYSFKASPRTPPAKGKNKGRARGRKATVSKKKANKESVIQQKASEGDQNDLKEIIEENHQRSKSKKRDPGIKTMVAYGKEPGVVLFDDVLERNTDPFSSPADIEQNGGKTKQNQKKKVNQSKQEVSVELSHGNKSSDNLRELVDEISRAEDYDLVFSQQVRDDAEEYRKMFKKRTRGNPRNNRVSFDDDVIVVTDDGLKASHDLTGSVNTDNENRSEADDIVNESIPKPEQDETRYTANAIHLHENISTDVEKSKVPMRLRQKLRRSDPVLRSALEKGVYAVV